MRKIAGVLSMVLVLSFLLTACSSGGSASPGDTTMPGVPDTTTTPDSTETPSGTETPSNTPSNTETPDNTIPDIPEASARDFEYEYSAALGGVIITKYIGASVTEIRIPDKIDGNPVVKIGGNAFAFTNSSSLTSVTLPNSVKELDWGTLGCDSLKHVTMRVSLYASSNFLARDKLSFTLVSPDPDSTKTLKYTEPLVYNEEIKEYFDQYLAIQSEHNDTDIDAILDEIYVDYSKYLNVNISKDAVKVSLFTGGGDSSGITPKALEMVNDYLETKGEDMLILNDSDQRAETVKRLTAIWLAASLYYDPEVEDPHGAPCYDIAIAFALTKCDPSKPRNDSSVNDWPIAYANSYHVTYCDLFDIPRP